MSFGAGEQHDLIPGNDLIPDPENDDFIAYLGSHSPDPNGATVLNEDWTSLINKQTSRAAAATAAEAKPSVLHREMVLLIHQARLMRETRSLLRNKSMHAQQEVSI